MSFDEPYSPIAVTEMKGELESILHACRVNVKWRLLNDSVHGESFSNLLLARFHGACHEVKDDMPLRVGALGHTHVTDGAVLPFSEIDCTKVRRFVEPELRPLDYPRSEKMLGRALGRVLAHEVFHIILKTRHHGTDGVAKAVLSARELVRGHLGFDRPEADLIRKRFPQPLPAETDLASKGIATEPAASLGRSERPAMGAGILPVN